MSQPTGKQELSLESHQECGLVTDSSVSEMRATPGLLVYRPAAGAGFFESLRACQHLRLGGKRKIQCSSKCPWYVPNSEKKHDKDHAGASTGGICGTFT
jgi:hypothetical protein